MVWRASDALFLRTGADHLDAGGHMQMPAHLGPHAYAVLSILFSPNKLRENATRLVSADNEKCQTKEIVTLNKKKITTRKKKYSGNGTGPLPEVLVCFSAGWFRGCLVVDCCLINRA